MIESAEQFPGAMPLQPKRQGVWPYASKVQQPICKLVSDDAVITQRRKYEEKYHAKEVVEKPIEIPPSQPSLAHADMTAVYRTLPLATMQEIDVLIKNLDSMRLARFIRMRKEAEERLDSLREDLKQAAWDGAGLDEFQRLYNLMEDEHRKYRECNQSVNEMIQRGVRS